MIKRHQTKKIKIGNITIGGSNHIIMQTMLTNKTSNIDESVKMINQLETIGCEVVRVSVLDEADAKSIKEIKQQTKLPIVADIHFSPNLALLSIENGADAIRLNPGNITNNTELEKICQHANQYHIPIRIGINTGSYKSSNPKVLVNAILKQVKLMESFGFFNLILAIKSSDIETTVKANLLLAKKTSYPLHLGLTEAGDFTTGIIKSTICLTKLLNSHIGNTIRISLPGLPTREIDACKTLLHQLGLRQNTPEIISCPTCGRLTSDTTEIIQIVKDSVSKINKNIKIAVMGCIVNGVGEAKNANIGIFPIDKNNFVIYVDGKIKTKVSLEKVSDELVKIINNY